MVRHNRFSHWDHNSHIFPLSQYQFTSHSSSDCNRQQSLWYITPASLNLLGTADNLPQPELIDQPGRRKAAADSCSSPPSQIPNDQICSTSTPWASASTDPPCNHFATNYTNIFSPFKTLESLHNMQIVCCGQEETEDWVEEEFIFIMIFLLHICP